MLPIVEDVRWMLGSALVGVLALFAVFSDGSGSAGLPVPPTPDRVGDAGLRVIGEPLEVPTYTTAPPLADPSTGWFNTAQDLVEALLTESTLNGDLARFRVSETEHERLLWPSFPSSEPLLNIPHDFAWANLDHRSRRGESALRAQLRDRTWSLVELRFDSGPTFYSSFVLHEGTRATVGNDLGETEEIELLGSVVEYGGLFKLLSYREP